MKSIDSYQKHTRQTNKFGTGPRANRVFAVRLQFCCQKIEEAFSNPATTRERKVNLLGNMFWYIAQQADIHGIELSEALRENLKRSVARWKCANDDFYDHNFPPGEQLPRKLLVRIAENKKGQVRMFLLVQPGNIEVQIGDRVTDNSDERDDFAFHDVFHLANATILEWSPVFRDLMGRKRKSQPKVDEVQDGARAKDLEEQIVAFVFEKARQSNFFDGVAAVEFEVLHEVVERVQHLEVRSRSYMEWERAILVGFEIFREIRKYRSGYISLDLLTKTIVYHPTMPILDDADICSAPDRDKTSM